MSGQRVLVTYTAPLQLQSSDQWTQIQAGLSAHLPLHDLHWKPATRLSPRTIQVLDVNLVPYDSLKEEGTLQIPLSLLERPFLNMYIVTCEDNDTYKGSVRKQIRDWHSVISQRKNQEWLIVLVVRPDVRTGSSAILKMRGTILDRLKTDFNVDKKDRCAQLTWTNDFHDPANWADVLAKVKTGITAAFDAAVAQREEEIKRSEGQRTMPGWNFCTFFLLKESLAFSFEGMNLLEDALIQYDELEASFFQVLKDRNLPWFGNLIDPTAKDDSLPLLSITKKPYRELILANTISVFDFRVYLLARQCSLLGQMGRVIEVGRKVTMFLGAFGVRLRQIQGSLPEFFLESWTYSSALSTITTCDEWARGRDMDAAATSSYNAIKGELVELARTQLDRMGIGRNFLPNDPPFACVYGSEEDIPTKPTSPTLKRGSLRISNTDLSALLNGKTDFYDNYVRLTNRAIDLYVKAGRRKFALKLHSTLAALDLYRERHFPALQTYTSLHAHYAPHKWRSLESFVLFRSITSHARMQSNHDREWLHTALAFLKAFIGNAHSGWLVDVPDEDAYISGIVSAIIESAADLDSDVIAADYPAMMLYPLEDTCRCAGDRDGHLIEVDIVNLLPQSLPSAEVSITLAGNEVKSLRFATTNVELPCGRSRVTLFCPVPATGLFLIEGQEVRLGHLLLQWPLSKERHRRSRKAAPKLVRLAKDIHALDVQLYQPRNVRLGVSSRLSLSLRSGRNRLLRSFIGLSSTDVQLRPEDCSYEGGRHEGISFSADGITAGAMDSDSELNFSVPYEDPATTEFVRVHCDVEYATSNEPELIRSLRISRSAVVAQPLHVNVKDFYREDRLFTTFTVSARNDQHIQLAAVDLCHPQEIRERLEIVKLPQRIDKPITVTSRRHATFLFQLKIDGDVKEPLELKITYRNLREEVERLLSEYERDDPSERQDVACIVLHAVSSDVSWIPLYESTGEIRLPSLDYWDSRILSVLDYVSERLRTIKPEDVRDSSWREATSLVDVPRIDILAAACVRIVASPFQQKSLSDVDATPIYAGQPITAILTIRTSLRWSGDKSRKKRFPLRFHVDVPPNDWIVSGQRLGGFNATDGTTHTGSFTIMALRHGEIPLPSVHVSVLHEGLNHLSAPTLETYQEHGAEKVTILPRGARTTFLLTMETEHY